MAVIRSARAIFQPRQESPDVGRVEPLRGLADAGALRAVRDRGEDRSAAVDPLAAADLQPRSQMPQGLAHALPTAPKHRDESAKIVRDA
jgi:hypothetical protein